MEAIRNEEFLTWAARAGIGFDPSYPEASCLRFLPPCDFSRFWTLPDDPRTWPHFAGSLLEGLDCWSAGFLWPRSGQWPVAEHSSSYNEGVRDVVLRGAGIFDGWSGAIRFEHAEEDQILAVMFVFLAFGWCVDDDLYFIPDHGRQIVQTDHHDVVHVECLEENRIQEFVEHMAGAGYELPTELPDQTFIWPYWMGENPDTQ
jgi:hypothetical protein